MQSQVAVKYPQVYKQVQELNNGCLVMVFSLPDGQSEAVSLYKFELAISTMLPREAAFSLQLRHLTKEQRELGKALLAAEQKWELEKCIAEEKAFLSSKIKITFITGNKKKLEEFMSIIVGSPLESKFEITNKSMDLNELQGTPEFIAASKAKEATNFCDTAVLVEDVSLCFNAFKGLPGPYIKDFLQNLGREGLYNMLKGFEDKTAYAQCTFAFCPGKGQEAKLFIGKCSGKIVPPSGDNAFGWDPVFMPDNFNQTFAEMPLDVKN